MTGPQKLNLAGFLRAIHFWIVPVTRDALFRRYDAQAIKMEGAAVAQVTQIFNEEALIARCLSDLAGVPVHVDIKEFIWDAGSIAMIVVHHILQNLKQKL